MSKHLMTFLSVSILAASTLCPLGHRLGASGSAPTGAGSQVPLAGTETVVGGIAASAEVQQLLRKTRDALGGQARLLGVRSLVVESVVTVGPQPPEPTTQLILLPDRFLERRSRRTFVVNGTEYWQQPEPDQATMDVARQSTTKTFASQCLLFLLRAPDSMPLRATRSEASDTQLLVLAFEGAGGFRRGLEIDAASLRLRAITFPSVLTSAEGTVKGTGRTSIAGYQQVDGISFPTRTRTRMDNADIDIATEYHTIRVDTGVQRSDFVKK